MEPRRQESGTPLRRVRCTEPRPRPSPPHGAPAPTPAMLSLLHPPRRPDKGGTHETAGARSPPPPLLPRGRRPPGQLPKLPPCLPPLQPRRPGCDHHCAGWACFRPPHPPGGSAPTELPTGRERALPQATRARVRLEARRHQEMRVQLSPGDVQPRGRHRRRMQRIPRGQTPTPLPYAEGNTRASRRGPSLPQPPPLQRSSVTMGRRRRTMGTRTRRWRLPRQ
mmetsp:Transcript_24593/g.61254  ORF Transcript_24593/g.61254 Transcript_24593/m.61254 type:complete len:223 (-) Transcript_24593:2629-3297(-)